MHTASENLTSDSKESATEPPLADEGQKSELAAEKEGENATDKNDKSHTTGDGDEPGALEVEQEVEQSPEVEDEPGAIVMKKNSEDSLAEEKLETPSEKANSVRNDLQANKVDDAPANTDSEPSSDNVIPSKHKIPSQPLGKPTFLQEKIDNRIPTSDDIINEQEVCTIVWRLALRVLYFSSLFTKSFTVSIACGIGAAFEGYSPLG